MKAQKKTEDESVTTICYGKRRVWPSRKKAMDFFYVGMCSCDGCEGERYKNIYIQLNEGASIATDGEAERAPAPPKRKATKSEREKMDALKRIRARKMDELEKIRAVIAAKRKVFEASIADLTSLASALANDCNDNALAQIRLETRYIF